MTHLSNLTVDEMLELGRTNLEVSTACYYAILDKSEEAFEAQDFDLSDEIYAKAQELYHEDSTHAIDPEVSKFFPL